MSCRDPGPYVRRSAAESHLFRSEPAGTLRPNTSKVNTMSDQSPGTSPRQDLLDLIPLRDVPPGTFGGANEAREKYCDEIVTLVESWLLAHGEGTASDRQPLAVAWRREMGRDVLLTATLDQIEATNEDRTALMRAIAEKVPRYARQAPDRLIIRLHPDSWNRYSLNISGALMGASDAVRQKVVERCNFRQPQDLVTISTTEADGDVVCGVHLLR
jgi:hypothetical protein